MADTEVVGSASSNRTPSFTGGMEWRIQYAQ